MTPADRDVLTSLPRARPTRRSAKRGSPMGATAPEAVAPEAPTPTPTTTTTEPSAARRTPAAAKARTGAARDKHAAANAATGAAQDEQAATAPARTTAAPRPKTVAAERETPHVPAPAAGWASPEADEEPSVLSGGGPLLRPAVRACGGLAHLYLAVGRRGLAKLIKP